MKTILIGATGATGADLLLLLLQDTDVESVNVFVRRALEIKHEKLKVHVINFDKPQQWAAQVKGDVLFSCLGTTLKAAGSKKEQWKVDYKYQYQFAKIAKSNGVQSYVLVSSDLASVSSPFFYTRMKGQLEEDVRKLEFSSTIIFRPRLLDRKNSKRMAEVISVNTMKFFNALGLLKTQRPLSTHRLAAAMLYIFKRKKKCYNLIKSREIWQLVEETENKQINR